MMGRARTALLLVAFSLLTSAATAYAECAWVLWVKQEQGLWSWWAGPTWQPHATHKSEKECLDSLVIGGQRSIVAATAKCLPDGTDPRGPKTK